MKVFYHGDMDGIVSAFLLCTTIVNWDNVEEMMFQSNNLKCAGAFEFDYNKQDKIKDMFPKKTKESVYFVDCSPNKELLDYIISKSGSVFIIDHHISKKEMLEELFEANKIEGMFYNGASASLITYCWGKMIKEEGKTVQEVKDFLDWFGNSRENQEKSDVPFSIKLVNSWDIWNGMYIDAEPFKIAFEASNFKPLDISKLKKILYNDRIVSTTIDKGYIMKTQITSWGNLFMERYGYEVNYKKNRFFVANLGNGNSKYFGDRIKDYDAVIAYCFNGELWTFSIYSDSSKDFDCSEFAKKFNGGGHKKAAGFRTDKFPTWLKKSKEERSV